MPLYGTIDDVRRLFRASKGFILSSNTAIKSGYLRKNLFPK